MWINNLARAKKITILGKNENQKIGVFLITLSERERERIVFQRLKTGFVRSAEIWQANFPSVEVENVSEIGRSGLGLQSLLSSFQISKVMTTAAALGSFSTAMRIALLESNKRRLYGARLHAIPHVRAILARSIVNLWIGENVARFAIAMANQKNRNLWLISCVAKSFVPCLAEKTVRELGVLMGARGHWEDNGWFHGAFNRIARDISFPRLVHTSSVVCRSHIALSLIHI